MKNQKNGLNPKLNRTAWLFIIPSLILIVAFVFYPMIQAFVTSFQTGVGNNLEFSGLTNYKRLLTDTTFKKALVLSLIHI